MDGILPDVRNALFLPPSSISWLDGKSVNGPPFRAQAEPKNRFYNGTIGPPLQLSGALRGCWAAGAGVGNKILFSITFPA
jgi:hypothetical protein